MADNLIDRAKKFCKRVSKPNESWGYVFIILGLLLAIVGVAMTVAILLFKIVDIGQIGYAFAVMIGGVTIFVLGRSELRDAISETKTDKSKRTASANTASTHNLERPETTGPDFSEAIFFTILLIPISFATIAIYFSIFGAGSVRENVLATFQFLTFVLIIASFLMANKKYAPAAHKLILGTMLLWIAVGGELFCSYRGIASFSFGLGPGTLSSIRLFIVLMASVSVSFGLAEITKYTISELNK